MYPTWFYARRDLRARWGSFVTLGVIAGLAAGVVLAAWGGSRRSASAIDRFLTATHASSIGGTSNLVDDETFAKVAALPMVTAGSRAIVFAIVVPELFARGEFLPFLGDPSGVIGTEVERPLVIEGRRANPDSVDEIELDESVSRVLQKGVGDTITLASITAATMSDFEANGRDGLPEPDGPPLDFRVVGVVRRAYDLVTTDTPPTLLTPAFTRAYRDQIGSLGSVAWFRLRNGVADNEAFTEQAKAIVGSTDLVFEEVSLQDAIGDGLNVSRVGLLIFSGVGALAFAIAIGQSAVRTAHHGERDRAALDALGLTRRQRVVAAVLPLVSTAAVTLVLAGVIGPVASRRVMTAAARRADPDFGSRFDALVLVGAVVAALVPLVGGGVAALRRGVSEREFSTRSWYSLPVSSPTAVAGAAMALRPGRADRAVPVRSAFIATTVAIAGVVGGLVYAHGLDKLSQDPQRWGFTSDALVSASDDAYQGLLESPDVAGLADFSFGLAIIGGRSLSALGLDSIRGAGIGYEVIEGRAPAADDEVVLGRDALHTLGKRLGDEVEADGVDGTIQLRIVGQAAFPSLDGRGSLAGAAGFTRAGFDSLSTNADDNLHQTLVDFAPEVDTAELFQRLGIASDDVAEPVMPSEIANLQSVRSLPKLLAAFLAALGLAALGHTLITTAARRRRDLAIDRTLGFRVRQVGATMVWQSVSLIGFAVVVGLPLGVVAGRLTWTTVSRNVGVRVENPVPAIALLVVVAVALATTAAITYPFGYRLGRRSPAAVLRAE
ncbi:MAG: FtsX-like permease family protein [Acidimicrobiales bacterium]